METDTQTGINTHTHTHTLSAYKGRNTHTQRHTLPHKHPGRNTHTQRWGHRHTNWEKYATHTQGETHTGRRTHHHHHQSLNREGRSGTTDDFATSFLHFFPVLQQPMGLAELQACSFPDVVFPPLPLSTWSSSPLH